MPVFARKPGFPETVRCEFSEKALMLVKAALLSDLAVSRQIEKAPTPEEAKAVGLGLLG